jgi:hypothetical protein
LFNLDSILPANAGKPGLDFGDGGFPNRGREHAEGVRASMVARAWLRLGIGQSFDTLGYQRCKVPTGIGGLMI